MIVALPQAIIGNPWKFSHDPAADPKHAVTDEVHFGKAFIENPAKDELASASFLLPRNRVYALRLALPQFPTD